VWLPLTDAADVRPALLLEQQGRKVNEIVSPDRPLVVTWGFDSSHGKSFHLEFGNGSLVRLQQSVVDTAGHPQQPQVGLLRRACRELGKRFGTGEEG
jgi:hypothetical protein